MLIILRRNDIVIYEGYSWSDMCNTIQMGDTVTYGDVSATFIGTIDIDIDDDIDDASTNASDDNILLEDDAESQ